MQSILQFYWSLSICNIAYTGLLKVFFFSFFCFIALARAWATTSKRFAWKKKMMQVFWTSLHRKLYHQKAYCQWQIYWRLNSIDSTMSYLHQLPKTKVTNSTVLQYFSSSVQEKNCNKCGCSGLRINFMAKLQFIEVGYDCFPLVHISKLTEQTNCQIRLCIENTNLLCVQLSRSTSLKLNKTCKSTWSNSQRMHFI